ncbi:MAG: DUF4249 domain-containing protein [Bacteroidales bacterium]|nr:DUF4249 domain-containing protein [Bacteroidales bacterium]
MKPMIKSRNILILSLITLVASSCTERIDIKLNDSDKRLVVDGAITTDTMVQRIRLTESANYFSNEAPPAVTEATVYLDNGSEKLLLAENPAGSGVYQTPEAYAGQKGTTYTLEIGLKDKIGGKDQFVANSMMPETAFSIDSISLEYQAVWDFWFVKLYAYDPPTKDFYRIDALRNGVMLTDTASRVQVTEDRFFNGNNTNGLSVLFLYADEVHPGDTITLILSAITEEYFNFFIQLQTESGGSNPLFSGPPANVVSNVKEGGLGFFNTLSSKRSQLVVRPEFFKN